jgi:hypothetical protein
MASDSFRRRSSDKCRIQSIGGGDPAIAHRGQRKRSTATGSTGARALPGLDAQGRARVPRQEVIRTVRFSSVAPLYVDLTHRSALLYAFAGVLLSRLCEHGAWSNAVNLRAAMGLQVFFATSVVAYFVH